MESNVNSTPSDPKMNRLLYRTGSPGYWTLALLPLALFLSDKESNPQTSTAIIIITFNSVYLGVMNYFTDDFSDTLDRLKSTSLTLAILALAYCYTKEGVLSEYASYLALNFTFPYVFRNFIKWYPKSFTFGEGMLVCSAFCYNVWVTSQNLPFPPSSLAETSEPVLVNMFIQMGFFGTLILARCLLMLTQPLKIYTVEELYVVWAKCVFGAFAVRLFSPQEDAWFLVFWIPRFLLANSYRIISQIYWAVWVITAVAFVWYMNSQNAEATTIHRKVFHFLIVCVYVPILSKDISLVYFCSSVVLFGFLLIETIRALKFEYFGIQFGILVDNVISRFRDSQDEGKLILTPIYLLAGCSMPIWLVGLYSVNNEAILSAEAIAAALSGILSIGIGDTFASIGGSIYGKTKWPGSDKSLEGTLCSIASQILFVILLCAAGVIQYTTLSITALVISSVINAIVEAKTDQIDNLVVPLTAYNVVQAIFYCHDKMFS